MSVRLLSAILLASATQAAAGTLVVTGDATIAARQAQNVAGNVQFARNILNGGMRVVIAADSVNFLVPAQQEASFNGFGGGVTATSYYGPITADRLAGTDLFVLLAPSNPITTAEIGLLSGFLAGGGTLLLGGEAVAVGGTVTNDRVNAVLAGLGSSIRLGNESLDLGDQFAEGGEILANPLTSGITRFGYGYTTTLSGGTTLFSASTGQAFVAAEQIGGMVPEPATWLAMIVGFGLVGGIIRRGRGEATVSS